MGERTIQERISSVLEARREYVPAIAGKVQQLGLLEGQLHELDAALKGLAAHPDASSELKSLVDSFHVNVFTADLASAKSTLVVARNRLERETVNIGVSGQARVGKSTLLQTVAGLTEQQVPTGSGLPVTAVRSRLIHSDLERHATLVLHSEESFLKDIIRPYHEALGIHPVPASLGDFQRFDYPKAFSNSHETQSSHVTLFKRLEKIQQASPRFVEFLSGGTRIEELENLRPWIAYPTMQEDKDGNADHRYLAVREAIVKCTFPDGQVNGLTIIDMPGLGEVDAKAEEHHIHGLQNEVDMVLMVKRPLEGAAFWQDVDSRATDLLDRVRGDITLRSDFVAIVMNVGGEGVNQKLVESLRYDINERANAGARNTNFRVMECDAKNTDSVRSQMIEPLLEHLAKRLPVMDQEVVEAATRRVGRLCKRIGADLERLDAGIKTHAPEASHVAEEVLERSKALREDLTGNLREVVSAYFERARSELLSPADEALIAAIRGLSEEIDSWAVEGMGRGREAWTTMALRNMQVHNSPAPITVIELNSARVHVGDAFSRLDQTLTEEIETLLHLVAESFIRCMGNLLVGTAGRETLELVSRLLGDAHEPCLALKGAVDDILALQVTYRGYFHPLVRERLDTLSFTVRGGANGGLVPQFTGIEITEQGANDLLKILSSLTSQAAYNVEQAMLDEIKFPALILHAASEQFEDSVIRSKDSEKEFNRLGRSYRNDLWPGVFEGLDAQNARVSRVRRAIVSIGKTISKG